MHHSARTRRHQANLTYFCEFQHRPLTFVSTRKLQQIIQKNTSFPDYLLKSGSLSISTNEMPAAFASSKSSKDGDSEPHVSTMTSGDNASASASSKNKDGGSIFQTSKSTGDGAQTKKTIEKRDAEGNGKKEVKSVSKGSGAKKDETDESEEGVFAEAGGAQGVFAKAGGAFAAAGGAVASVTGGKAVASAE
jgi:hypothetical protein